MTTNHSYSCISLQKLLNSISIRTLLTIELVLCSLVLSAQIEKQNNDFDIELLNKYVQENTTNSIVFDQSNIKQFWIDNSVVSLKDSFVIMLKETNTRNNNSGPLKIQLANVNETQDCKVEVIADTKDFAFTIMDNQSKTISTSSVEDPFIDYNVVSSTFHVEDTQNTTFYISFSSKTKGRLYSSD